MNSHSESASLGNSTKFASPLARENEGENTWSKTVTKYWLQSLARELLPPDHRIGVCMHCMSPVASSVDINKHPESARAYYSGLMVCGSVWVCSVCAARITEERRQELTRALSVSNFAAYLVTYTLSHKAENSLLFLVNAMLPAFRSMKSGKAWQHLQEDYGWQGSIKSLEVTHGANGWHPHQHELVLLDKSLSKSAQNGLLSDLRDKWGKAVAKRHLWASVAHGVDLRGTDKDVQDYVAKFGHEPVVLNWGIEHELTKQPVKRGKFGGRTPAQLLADYGVGDIRAGRLWREYADVFKGKKQLVWSKGLRDILGVGVELADDEIARSLPQGTEVLARLSPVEWKAIRKADLRGELLDAAGSMDAHKFRQWLNSKLEVWL